MFVSRVQQSTLPAPVIWTHAASSEDVKFACFRQSKELPCTDTKSNHCSNLYVGFQYQAKYIEGNKALHSKTVRPVGRPNSRPAENCSTAALTNRLKGMSNCIPDLVREFSVPQDTKLPLVELEASRTVEVINETAVVACLRSDSSRLALDAARSALDGGISVLEITLTTPSAVEVIGTLVREYPSATIGAGTVLSLEGAKASVDAGARFLMSPATDEDLVRHYRGQSTVVIPGAMTPTEVLTATKLGARMVKVFPIGSAGSEGFVRAMQRAMPGVLLVPAHQITLDMVMSYVSAGASAVVLSDAIFSRQAMAAQDFTRIRQLAASAARLGLESRRASNREY